MICTLQGHNAWPAIVKFGQLFVILIGHYECVQVTIQH